MSEEGKAIASKEETWDKLEIRVGHVLSAILEPTVLKPSYRLEIDFGKFGKKISVARFTKHGIEEIQGKLVLGVLNFGPRQIGEVSSEVLVLGVQYPKADSGEATPISPWADAKIGGKVF